MQITPCSTETLSRVLVLLALAGCCIALQSYADLIPEPEGSSGSPSGPDTAIDLTEVFFSPVSTDADLDSIALYPTREGSLWAIVTAKASHQLLVFDAENGHRVRTIGGHGLAPGSFSRPNGIQMIDDLLLVVETDNARVQILKLPDFTPLGMVGEGDLGHPLGLSCYRLSDGSYRLFVTDQGARKSRSRRALPIDRELGEDYLEPVKVFTFVPRITGISARFLDAFGDQPGSGRLKKVESIQADPDYNRLFIAEEWESGRGIKIFDLDGNFSGAMLEGPAFRGDPEGVALIDTPPGGYLIVTDQTKSLTQFQIYDRISLRYLGSFHGRHTANTDGIATVAIGTPTFPDGGFWAIHDNQALAAFDWRAIKTALGLNPAFAGRD